ncbi:sorting nexin-11 [Salarias fasciatus]|uniref:PX domain-containing protein n=1 Tax=Salarias fasciatus TaxID=181472 RepID=A0A672H980_SALFA|nr:sorting nexin-11 [Salarias fasciatus]
MNSNHEEDEFVAVRVQDPRIQNEGSWNSYVDYKIFLHTNSKAFTAKTSCVRRRYSEFVWLRKKMQKNAGLVPVPDLPGKSFFSFSNEDFLERRRKGLQLFLEKVVHTTVCLSDSQLHLFLQTQLPIGHIQDCVQGHTPYSVTDAILTYASSNRGLAQAQEDDPVKDSSLTVSYESMESPALHPPGPQTNEAFSPELLSCGDADPLEDLLELAGRDSAGPRHEAEPCVRISQRRNQLEAVVERRGAAQARFYLDESLDPAGRVQTGSHILTPADVHSPVGRGVLLSVDSVFEPPDAAAPDGREEGRPERFDGSIEILAFRDDTGEEPPAENGVGAPEDDTAGDGAAGDGTAAAQTKEDTLQEEGLCDQETPDDLMGTDEDSQSLASSDGSIVQVSDEEEEDEDRLSIHAANGLVQLSPDGLRRWAEAEAASGGDVLDLQVNGCAAGKQDRRGESPDVKWAAGDGDLTENSDISILESSGAPGPAGVGRPEQDAAAAAADAPEVEVR